MIIDRFSDKRNPSKFCSFSLPPLDILSSFFSIKRYRSICIPKFCSFSLPPLDTLFLFFSIKRNRSICILIWNRLLRNIIVYNRRKYWTFIINRLSGKRNPWKFCSFSLPFVDTLFSFFPIKRNRSICILIWNRLSRNIIVYNRRKYWTFIIDRLFGKRSPWKFCSFSLPSVNILFSFFSSDKKISIDLYFDMKSIVAEYNDL